MESVGPFSDEAFALARHGLGYWVVQRDYRHVARAFLRCGQLVRNAIEDSGDWRRLQEAESYFVHAEQAAERALLDHGNVADIARLEHQARLMRARVIIQHAKQTDGIASRIMSSLRDLAVTLDEDAVWVETLREEVGYYTALSDLRAVDKRRELHEYVGALRTNPHWARNTVDWYVPDIMDSSRLSFFYFTHIGFMSTIPITPEIRAKILSSIKDDGVAITEAAKTYDLTEDTIRRWLRGTVDNANTSSSELQRLRRENQTLKEIIGNLLLDRELAKKNIARA
jgi:transposase-like protein